nr:class I SAM-dependent methyltransferase [Frankia sp. CcI49]
MSDVQMGDVLNGPLRDPDVHAVIERVRAEGRPPGWGPRPGGAGGPGGPGGRGGRGPRAGGGGFPPRDPFEFTEVAFPIAPEQGDLLYLLCRATGATRVAECATSLGISTLYLAAAMRDNGGGLVIGSEIVPEKAAKARKNLADAGLDHLVDIRVGDALETFADLGGPVDLLLVDGWPTANPPSLSRSIIGLVAPQLRPGAIVVNDNAEEDYLEYVRDPANGFVGMSLPLKGSTEVSVRVGA